MVLDRAALDRLVEEYYKPVLGFLIRRTGSTDLAEDLAQDVWCKAIAALPDQPEDIKIKPWLFKIATNVHTDHYRHVNARAHPRTLPEDNWPEPSHGSTPESALLLGERIAAVSGLARQLTSTQRRALRLCVLGYSYKHIAQKLGNKGGIRQDDARTSEGQPEKAGQRGGL